MPGWTRARCTTIRTASRPAETMPRASSGGAKYKRVVEKSGDESSHSKLPPRLGDDRRAICLALVTPMSSQKWSLAIGAHAPFAVISRVRIAGGVPVLARVQPKVRDPRRLLAENGQNMDRKCAKSHRSGWCYWSV